MSAGIPIIRLEVENMRRTIVCALSEASLKMDEDVRHAVERFCQPERIAAIIQAETERTLDVVIKEEVSKFFRFGEGRKVVAVEVKKRLLEATTYTPLDDV